MADCVSVDIVIGAALGSFIVGMIFSLLFIAAYKIIEKK